MFATYALMFAGIALLILILLRGLGAHLLSRYRVFYCYIAFVTITSLGQVALWAILGNTSDAFYWAWHIPNLLSHFFLIVVLVDIWIRVEPADHFNRRLLVVPCLLLGVTGVILTARLIETPGEPFFRYQAGALFVQMVISIFVYTRVSGRREINLGRNLKGVLLGISLLVGLQGVNFAHLLFVGTPNEVFVFCLQFFYFLALSVFTYSLWSYEPVIVVSAEYRNRLSKVGEELEKAVRILASSR